jgi:hypothetical protein
MSESCAKSCAVVLLVAALSGCGKALSPPAAGVTAAQFGRAAGGSWMLPEATNLPLVYVSDIYDGIVDVYEYGKSRQVGAIHGFSQPTGQCVDKKGDVWVAEYGGNQAFEFAHGETKPLQVLATNGDGTGCSIDPVSGDLAIANDYSPQNAWGDIQIFHKARGTPTDYYSNPGKEGCAYMGAPGYDDRGNLYFEARWGNGGLGICGLPAKGTAIVRVPIAKSKIFKELDHPGSVMWDGKYLTFEDYRNNASQNSVIYLATPNGSKLNVVGSVTLGATCRYTNVSQPFLLGAKNTPSNHTEATVVVGGPEGCYSLLGYWHYPAGGVPFKAKPGPAQIGGASVSLVVP